MSLIRRAEKKDIPGINKLLAQVLLVHHKGRADIFKETGQKYTDSELELLIKKTENPIFVFEDDEKTFWGIVSVRQLYMKKDLQHTHTRLYT